MSTDFHRKRQRDGVPATALDWPSAAAKDQSPVDVAIVAESTYPYRKGGVSAVIHDIIQGNPDLSFGIVHVTWDRAVPHAELYEVPANVSWIHPVFLSMREHRTQFMRARPADLRLRPAARRRLAERLFEALRAVTTGEVEPLWQLYDDGLNPRTRQYPLWALLGTRELMQVAYEQTSSLGLSLVETFWLLREFFSLAYALLHDEFPPASIYHAHTTGYASLLGAAAARQQKAKFLLTEHNLYVRDTINTLLDRNMALSIAARDWREFDVKPIDRAWMAWWIEMGRLCYPVAEYITYLYPSAITEASDLDAPIEKAVVIPNGVILEDFDRPYQQRQEALSTIDEPNRNWRLAYIARVVPIKGLLDLIESVALLVNWGVTQFHLDVLGPTDHAPEYFEQCQERIRERGVEEYVTFHGTVNVREWLGTIDLLVLPSYNEGQPVVVLEAMAAGVPIVGTNVGGMTELTVDHLTTPAGETWTECAVLIDPDYVVGMARAIRTVMQDPRRYMELARNSRGRIEHFFQLGDVVAAYNQLYRELAGLPVRLPSVDGGLVQPRRSPGPTALATERPAGEAHAQEERIREVLVAEARDEAFEPEKLRPTKS